MQISSASSAGSTFGLQALRDLFQPSSSSGTGQSLPTSQTVSSARSAPSGPPPKGYGGGSFNPATLGALLGSQESASSLGDLIVGNTDTDGDGGLSLDELATSLKADASDLSDLFSEIDADSDGSITGGELDAGLKARFERDGPPAPPPSSADIASSLLASADADQNGCLNLSEVAASLGDDQDDAWSNIFKSLDSDGDGGLGASELSSAIQAAITRQVSAYGAPAENKTSTASISA